MSGGDGSESVAPWVRVFILLAALVAAAFLSERVTGSIVPVGRGPSLVFQSGLLLVVLGSAIIEHKFTKPADSAVNALASIVALVTVADTAPNFAWSLVFAYCVGVLIFAVACVIVSTGPDIAGWRRTVATWTYRPAVVLGRARLIFSVVFLFGVFTHYEVGSTEAALLVVFWGVYLAIWPLKIPQALSRMRRSRLSADPAGKVLRREWPGLMRVELKPNASWVESNPYLHRDADGVYNLVVPLYKQHRSDRAIGTGLSVPYEDKVPKRDFTPGLIYQASDLGLQPPSVNTALGASEDSTLVGFVIEDSRIGSIKFETWKPEVCREGLLAYCSIGGTNVYYQITEGATREESLETDRLGSQLATAAQLGVLQTDRGFVKYDWLPVMNTPVFAVGDDFGADIDPAPEDFIYGQIPGTKLSVTGSLKDSLDFHTAILGVTGAGKTELGFEMIRHYVDEGTKVICIDLTARYGESLDDLTPTNLSLSEESAQDLSDALHAVETGKYGAPDEKEALAELREELHNDVKTRLEAFLTGEDDTDRVGLITLDEISNTKATLVVTELFMTCLLHYARDNPDQFDRTLVVVEEAHTVMPETSTMGVGDYDARGLVGKIAQIALQGRKYGVGLLVIAQRTATVSKTVLTQCNTVIAFTSYDETSVGFLSSMYGRSHAEAIRDLPALNAVVFGKGVRSQRPAIVQIPYDAAKDPEGLIATW